MTWLSAHYEWVVGIVLILIAVVIAWLQLRKKEPSAANIVTQSPNLTFSPVIHFHQTAVALEDPKTKAVVDATKPAISHPKRHDVAKTPIPVSGTHQSQMGIAAWNDLPLEEFVLAMLPEPPQ